APVAGGVTDREHDRPVQALGLGQRFRPPGPPVHWVVLVLQQIRRGRLRQAVLMRGVLGGGRWRSLTPTLCPVSGIVTISRNPASMRFKPISRAAMHGRGLTVPSRKCHIRLGFRGAPFRGALSSPAVISPAERAEETISARRNGQSARQSLVGVTTAAGLRAAQRLAQIGFARARAIAERARR